MPNESEKKAGLSQLVVAAIAAGLLLSTWMAVTIIVIWIVVDT
jgi:hypothetical protein